MISAILLIILVIFTIVYLIFSSKHKHENFPPGPFKLPFWGSYWYILKENYNHAHLAIETLGKKYNTDILGLYLGDTPCIVPLTNELCREAYLKDEFNGRNDTIITRLRAHGILRGIFFMDGPYWKDQRRFSLRHLRDFGFGRRSKNVENFVKEEILYMIDLLTSEAKDQDKDIVPEKGVALMPDLIYGPMMNTTFLMLCSTKFDNKKLREVGRAGLKFQRSGDATGNSVSITPWLRHIPPKYFGYKDATEGNEVLYKFVEDIILKHKDSYIPGYERDLIDVFISEQIKLNKQEGFTDIQLLMVVLDYMFPSAIAIGHTMSFMLAFLINYPLVQRKIQDEIEKIVGNSRLPDLNDRKYMDYTEATIREVIRILPLNPLGIPRRCMEDTEFGGYFIPKDTIVLISAWNAHHDPKVWNDPELFKPERFLDENGKLMRKDLTIGFGGGKRLCAGETLSRQNMFLMVTGFLQHFNLEAAYTEKVDLTKIVPGVNLSIDDNYVRFVSR